MMKHDASGCDLINHVVSCGILKCHGKYRNIDLTKIYCNEDFGYGGEGVCGEKPLLGA